MRSGVGVSLSVLGWALNEEDNIGPYVEHAGRVLASVTDDYELIVIDDGSTDQTWALLQASAETRPWLRIVRNETTRGSGFNAKRAIGLASKDYLFWQTVDWSYDITELMASLPLLGTYDILQGVRSDALHLRDAIVLRSDSPYKGLVSYLNYWLIRLLFRLPLSDYQNVTVYPRALIQGVALQTESSFTNAECLLKTWWRGATFKEIHVPFLKRERGYGKGTRPWAIAAAIRDILFWWIQWVMLGRRPHRGRGRIVRANES